MSDRFTDRLSEYLDGGLTAPERHQLEAHLAACVECSRVLADLHGLVESARSLPSVPPAEDLWPGIAARIRITETSSTEAPVTAKRAATRRGLLDWLGRGVTLTLPQAVATAAVLIAIAGLSVWLALGRVVVPAGRELAAGSGSVARGPSNGSPADSGRLSGPASPGGTHAASAGFDPRYDATIAELQRVLAQERGNLDPNTVRVLERNLAIIDQAVTEARRAVEADSTNFYLRNHLAGVMRRKADLLRHAALLAGAREQEG